MRVTWTPRASANFDDLVSRLEEFSAGAGARLVDRVTERLSQLEAFPESGRIVPEFDERVFRELVEGDYRIIYERFADRVEVVAVVHGSRSLLDS
ncbi:MAG: type II toxin-antitoxin system RelE/ParE family toxin [Chloroflexi bacterium]|nr:type II toxin-antitoxin system RelE/ParE family toxin [Dehalococcoidia bacterium]MCO5201804.1 type II toxin-antitoxin system RelE/ParE family toxin [Chloroflexota bacterium]NJD63773.1 type II toxin-antitoxin system RelE/ParE family toxin [Chloroflexota bacterium]PWB45110.1 MAG: type II toxin-antitoxin system RelE/ParE family toxin [Dehalococcoidia bacterium]